MLSENLFRRTRVGGNERKNQAYIWLLRGGAMENILQFPSTSSDPIETQLEALKQEMARFPAGSHESVCAPLALLTVTPLGLAANNHRDLRSAYLPLRGPRYGQLVIRWLHACNPRTMLPLARTVLDTARRRVGGPSLPGASG